MSQAFIVAELSKNWRNGTDFGSTGPICRKFEEVINANYARGYVLHSFTLDRTTTQPGEMNETIIAVFRRIDLLKGCEG